MISLFSETQIRNEGSRHTDAFKFPTGWSNILTPMGAIVPVSAMNKMVIRGMTIILLMLTGFIAAGVVIVYTNKHAPAN